MKAPTVLLALLATGVAAGDFSRSCTDEHIDPSTEILTANCNTGDGKGTVASTSLDLNSCFAYEGNSIKWSSTGNFGEACSDCYVYRLPDPVYGPIFGTTRAWMNCTCNGAEAAINLDITSMSNSFGTLSCTS
ncbi:CVNH domain-containing protein [Colletotrichum graminicola M1.001]|uniref:CVNH domain-containing protein n=1 Tax=Colletotrichum graminicola (strain M1.001 / M2 / FGSC 10212) TaxID=645133 RepID=E3QUM2_COLGM|nr:CVNH domain-containing protein [Colletotrichum graminicola M1.001]EFQ34560.1 CVNH domain-containing protein [Colletotrichum graminicola M1.001]